MIACSKPKVFQVLEKSIINNRYSVTIQHCNQIERSVDEVQTLLKSYLS